MLIRFEYRARKNQQRSPLLRLPREVRELIWSFVFEGHMLHYDPWRPCKRGLFYAHWNLNLSTLQVSRQVYSETRFFPWQQNLFDLCAYSWKYFLRALRRMDVEYREHIYRIRMSVLNEPWLSYREKQYCEGLKDVASLIPNLKQITMCPIASADVDGSDSQKTMVERIRVVVEPTKQYFPDVEYEIEGHHETVSERTRLAMLGLDIE